MAVTPYEIVHLGLGSRLLCSFINILLFGILCLQCYLFFLQKEASRKPLLTYSVWAIILVNVIHVVSNVGDVYFFCITHYGDVELLLDGFTSPYGSTMVLASATSNLIVDVWFTWRVWILAGKNPYILVCLGGGTALTWLAGVGVASLAYVATLKVLLVEKWIILLYDSLSAATGMAWTILLCISLRRIRSHSNIVQTRSLLNYFLVYTVNTGLLAVILSITELVTCAVIPETFLHYSFYIMYSSLYSNALLGSLNAREWYWNNHQIISISLTNIGSATRTGNITNLVPDSIGLENMSRTAIDDCENQTKAGLTIDVTTDVVKATL